MNQQARDAGFTLDLPSGVPEAFVQTALLAGGVGLWEWPLDTERMALSPYLETLLGYPSGTFECTKAAFVARLIPIDRPRFELALANATDAGPEMDVEFRTPNFDVVPASGATVADWARTNGRA